MVMEDPVVGKIREKYVTLEALMDERTKRIWAATEALALGRGGVTRVMEATGMSRQRIASGIREVKASGRWQGGGTGRPSERPGRRT